MTTVNVAVCNGRHDIPQAMDGAVFKQTISEMNKGRTLKVKIR